MSIQEFGEILQPAAEEGQYQEFGKVIQPMSRGRSLLHAPLKGAVKRAGDIAGFAQSIAPFIPKGPLTQEKAHEYAEEKFPTYEREHEKFLERAGGLGVEALLSPGGIAAKAVQIPIGAGLGYAAEKLGAPPWVQSIAEGLPFFYKGGKKIPLKTNQKKLGEFMRREGLNENEISSMLKTPEQIELWSKWASKGKKSKKLMESVYDKTGKIYDDIKMKADSLPNPYIDPKNAEKFLTDSTKIIEELPHEYRKIIRQDAVDLIENGGTFNGFTNFYHDLNKILGGQRGGVAEVGRFKKPIMEALESISPELAQDFRLANDLFRTRAHVKGALISPKDFDKFLDIGEGLALGQGVYNRDIGMIGKVIGMSGARKLAREMLINPRLTNKSVRIGEALRTNKYMLAEKLVREFMDIYKESNPEEEIDFSGMKPSYD